MKYHVLLERYSIFYVSKHSINFEIADVTMSIKTREADFIFDSIFCIVNHFDMKLGQLVDIVISKIFRKDFAWFKGPNPGPRPFSFTKLSQLIKNQI